MSFGEQSRMPSVPFSQSVRFRRRLQAMTPIDPRAVYENQETEQTERELASLISKQKATGPFRESVMGARRSHLLPISFDPNYQQRNVRSSMFTPVSNATGNRTSPLHFNRQFPRYQPDNAYTNKFTQSFPKPSLHIGTTTTSGPPSSTR